MEPVDSASRWHRWSIKGAGDALSRVIDGLDARLPSGWDRLGDEALEPFKAFVRRGSAWYYLAPAANRAGATLSVERVLDVELRGGRVSIASGPAYPLSAAIAPASIPGAWDEVMRFLDEGIVPAARAVPGTTVNVPAPEDLFLDDVPAHVAERLQTFSRLARKLLPLNRAEGDRWYDFVIGAYRSRAIIDPPRFVAWLTHESWRTQDAAELSQRFYDQCRLLSRYADEVPAA